MNNELDFWKKRQIKKGRLRRYLLEYGPAPVEALLILAKRDNPNATLEDVENILRDSPHKFYQLDDSRWAAYPEEEIIYRYRYRYFGPYKKSNKHLHHTIFEGVDLPEAPKKGRFEQNDDNIPSVIIMGDELMMTGTPRLLIELKSADEKLTELLSEAYEEDTPIRFFLKSEIDTYFIGTRNILSLFTNKNGAIRLIASSAPDNSLRLVGPSNEQLLLLEQKIEPSQLPVSIEAGIVFPYSKIPSLNPSEKKSFTQPCNEKRSDFSAIRQEFSALQYRLLTQPDAWNDIKIYLQNKKPLIDKKSWETLLLMAINTPNARQQDLIEILYYYLSEDPNASFALNILECFSKMSDPEGKVAVLLENYAEIACNHNELNYSNLICIARSFYRSQSQKFEKAAQYYLKAIKQGGLSLDDLVKAIESFIFAENLPQNTVKSFIEYADNIIFGDEEYLPDISYNNILDALSEYAELTKIYYPGKLLKTYDKILGYLTELQKDQEARIFYEKYIIDLPKFTDRINLLSHFENFENIEILDWLIFELYELIKSNINKIILEKLVNALEQLENAEKIAGRDHNFSSELKLIISKGYYKKEEEISYSKKPLLIDYGISTIAIVGGSNIYQNRIKEELTSLGISKVILIQPTFEAHLTQSELKDKVKSADLIIHVTTYSKHAEHYMINNLENSPEFASKKKIPVNGGVSRSMREIMEAISTWQ